jgi:hypothetical protein
MTSLLMMKSRCFSFNGEGPLDREDINLPAKTGKWMLYYDNDNIDNV